MEVTAFTNSLRAGLESREFRFREHERREVELIGRDGFLEELARTVAISGEQPHHSDVIKRLTRSREEYLA